MSAVNNEGSCWIWTLIGAFGESELRISGRDKVYQPHMRYALKCLFSPDSTYGFFFLQFTYLSN